ncbi:hypothetical protein L7F22_063688 [Adiantum nelumboides]|nr:hypothetical protein [Adiantum nelumboides]
MAGGGGWVVSSGAEGKRRAELYTGGVTVYVVISCIVAAIGGSIFGYDLGISGGVTSMDDFLLKFFPHVYNHKKFHSSDTDYCKYNNEALTAFTSSLYIAGLSLTYAASYTTQKYGRRTSILIGGVSFLVGATLNAFAQNLAMLIVGRIMLGAGIGFGNQAVPLYLSEMAPAKFRGALNMLFQLSTTLGILIANLVNYATQHIHPWGWRLSLGLAAAPAALMTIGGIWLPETPNSLIERGYHEQGRLVLQKIRGTQVVDAEFEDLVEASAAANAVKHPFKNIFRKKNRPQLVMAIFIPAFQQLTGINTILFYAPVIFQSLGFGGNASLISAVVTGAVICGATLVSIAFVDKVGRKFFFLEGGLQMLLCQVSISVLLKMYFGGDKLPSSVSVAVVVLISLFIAAFGWSWGPLGWLVPSEIFPLDTRSAGQSITVSVNLLFTFIIAQSFLAMLCAFKYGTFLFFAGLVLIMSLFVLSFLPETKNVPIEEMTFQWRSHWFWKKVVPSEADQTQLNKLELDL